MAEIALQCSRCGHALDAHVGQSMFGEPRWHVSTVCPHCGAWTEADGGVELPDELRAEIVAQEGLWALSVEIGDVARVKAAAALRTILGLSMAETSAMMRALPAQVSKGTQTEMEYRQRLFEREGLHASVVLLEAGTPKPPKPIPEPCDLCGGRDHPRPCPRCGANACLACFVGAEDRHCRRCAFDVVREVLAGRRSRIQHLVPFTFGECDVAISPDGFELRRVGHRRERLYLVRAPGLVIEVLDRAGLARLDAPLVVGLRDVPCTLAAPQTMDLCAWLVPEADALQILLRRRPELPPTPQSIPLEGPFALPDPVPSIPPPAGKIREMKAPCTCPHCQHVATKFRALGDVLVCPACARSFAP